VSLYVDASVVMRLVLQQRGETVPRSALDGAASSTLTRVECLRTLDRLLFRRLLTDEEASDLMSDAHGIVDRLDLVELTPPILSRAASPFPAPLGTLHALHLATALLWRDMSSGDAQGFATHDEELARAARAVGFAVLGVPSSG
jgi:uncharacterized protein